MRTRLVGAGQVAILALLVFMVIWYRDFLAEKFEPVKNQLLSSKYKPWPSALENEDPLDSPAYEAVTTEETAIDSAVVEDVVKGEASEGHSDDDDDVDDHDDDHDDHEEEDEKADAEEKVLGEERLAQMVQAVFDPEDTTFQRLECPQPKGLARYEALKPPTADTDAVKFFFALDLTQCVDLLPRLLGSVVETIRFLGPENCALSIVEGNSDDGTPEVLEAIAADIEALGTEYFFQTSKVNPKGDGGRIVGLAQLRNLALQPMLDDTRRYSSPDTTVVFLNDVAICMEDILELVYQRSLLGADMTCAMDWTYVGRDPTFYDVWISRTITGESFFLIPEDKSWNYAWNLFWKDLETRDRFHSHLPFQVFSCWNGAAAFTAEPIVNKEVSFRSSNEGECFQGEPELLCKDFWHTGRGKIAVVPSVNLEYSDDRGKDIKLLKGYTSRWVGPEQDKKSSIDWQKQPPDQVKCMESLGGTGWRPWNETLER